MFRRDFLKLAAASVAFWPRKKVDHFFCRFRASETEQLDCALRWLEREGGFEKRWRDSIIAEIRNSSVGEMWLSRGVLAKWGANEEIFTIEAIHYA